MNFDGINRLPVRPRNNRILFAVLATSIFIFAGPGFPQEPQVSEQPEQPESKKSAENILWEVKSETTRIYILGSIHIADKSLYPLNTAITDAFEQSDVLSVEVNTENINPTDIQALTIRRGFYTDGKTLKQTLPPDLYAKLESRVKAIGMQMAMFERMKPWLAALTYSTLQLQHDRYDPAHGVDLHFLKKARAQKKEIRELESAEFQLGLFASWSKADQEVFLDHTLGDSADNTTPTSMTEILAAWKRGDIEYIDRKLIAPMREDAAMANIYKSLFTTRNLAMSKKIEDYLKGSEAHFVIVGAGHLIGPDSIIELLRSGPYKLRRI